MTRINIKNKQGKKIKRNSCIYKVLVLLLMPLLSSIIILPEVTAHCPLCTAATVVGVGVTRSLGWDDSIVGVFVGAMIVSSALWINNILRKKDIGGHAGLRIVSIILATFVLTILTFYYAGLFGLGNSYRIFGIEKLTFGTISGGIVSLGAFWISNRLKEKNEGKVFFNYQTMILTFLALILNAFMFWAVLK